MLNIVGEFTRECMAICVNRELNSADVINVLSDLLIMRGVLGHVRSDNRPEFVAKVVQAWIGAVGPKTAYIEPGSPWENGYCESFNSMLRDELLENWWHCYSDIRPHWSLGYRPPTPRVLNRGAPGCAT